MPKGSFPLWSSESEAFRCIQLKFTDLIVFWYIIHWYIVLLWFDECIKLWGVTSLFNTSIAVKNPKTQHIDFVIMLTATQPSPLVCNSARGPWWSGGAQHSWKLDSLLEDSTRWLARWLLCHIWPVPSFHSVFIMAEPLQWGARGDWAHVHQSGQIYCRSDVRGQRGLAERGGQEQERQRSTHYR